MTNTKRILVTGSNGYIGQHLIRHLQHSGYYTVGLDRVDLGINIADEFIHQDILDTAHIDGKFDTVIHLAALVQVGGGQKAMMDYYRTNVVGTMNMLERLDYKNFVFASTCQADARHVYGKTKLIGENIVRQYCEIHNKPYSIFRFGNVVGSDGFLPTNVDGLLYNLMKACDTGKFTLYGDDYNTKDGSALRDYIHVREICHAIKVSVEHPSCVPGSEIQPLYEYLGHGRLYSVKECIDAFKKVNGLDFKVVVNSRREGDLESAKQVDFDDISPYMPAMTATLYEMMKT